MGKIICRFCGRDINAIGQDNMSYSCSYACCEDCANGNGPRRKQKEYDDEPRYYPDPYGERKEKEDNEWGFHRSTNKSPWESRW